MKSNQHDRYTRTIIPVVTVSSAARDRRIGERCMQLSTGRAVYRHARATQRIDRKRAYTSLVNTNTHTRFYDPSKVVMLWIRHCERAMATGTHPPAPRHSTPCHGRPRATPSSCCRQHQHPQPTAPPKAPTHPPTHPLLQPPASRSSSESRPRGRLAAAEVEARRRDAVAESREEGASQLVVDGAHAEAAGQRVGQVGRQRRAAVGGVEAGEAAGLAGAGARAGAAQAGRRARGAVGAGHLDGQGLGAAVEEGAGVGEQRQQLDEGVGQRARNRGQRGQQLEELAAADGALGGGRGGGAAYGGAQQQRQLRGEQKAHGGGGCHGGSWCERASGRASGLRGGEGRAVWVSVSLSTGAAQ